VLLHWLGQLLLLVCGLTLSAEKHSLKWIGLHQNDRRKKRIIASSSKLFSSSKTFTPPSFLTLCFFSHTVKLQTII
jgi:hypothetical protein